MKSLEIINDYIDRLFIFENGTILIEKDELKTIKQDLEVLEILKNKTKYMLEDEVDRFEIFSLDEKVSKEDFSKVKQWLKENKNGR